jgi:hypothetical protein
VLSLLLPLSSLVMGEWEELWRQEEELQRLRKLVWFTIRNVWSEKKV